MVAFYPTGGAGRDRLDRVAIVESIDCIDCGGRCQRLPFEEPELGWEVGDVVSYRCRDCADMWYLEVDADDLDD